MRRRPSVTSIGALVSASTSSGAPRRLSLAMRSGLNCSRKIWLTWRCDTAATSKPGLSIWPTPSKVTSALTISTISTGKYIRKRTPCATELQDELGQREVAEARGAGPAAADLLDLAAEARRVAAAQRLRHQRQVARRVLRVAGDQAEVVVHQRAPQLLGEAPDHAEVDEADPRPGQDDQVAGVEVGVEEAVLVEHADDRRGAEVEELVALRVGERQGGGRAGLVAAQELHAQHVAPRVLAVDLGEARCPAGP